MKKKKAASRKGNTKTEQNSHLVEIVKVSIGSGDNPVIKSYVVPGTVHVSPGDTVTWWTKNTVADFFFPDSELFKEEKVQAKGVKELTLTVSEKAESKKRYPYAVFTDNNDFAEGGSFPVMIIK
jgi:plastocyanin